MCECCNYIISHKQFKIENGKKVEYWHNSFYDNNKAQKIIKYLKSRKGKNDIDKIRVHEAPCNKCFQCLKAKGNEWALRMQIEAYNFDVINNEPVFKWNYFYMLLLTYDDDHVPYIIIKDKKGKKHKQLVINKRDIQLFMKKLRKKYKGKEQFCYFQVGEYGEKTHRPHHHMVLFSKQPMELNYNDAMTTKKGQITYGGGKLTKIWGNGFVRAGEITRDNVKSMNYCIGYLNKITLKKPNKRVKESYTASKRPAPAKWYYDRNYKQLFSCLENDKDIGLMTWQGVKRKIPMYFERRLKQKDKILFDIYKTEKYKKNYKKMMERIDNNEFEKKKDKTKAELFYKYKIANLKNDDSWQQLYKPSKIEDYIEPNNYKFDLETFKNEVIFKNHCKAIEYADKRANELRNLIREQKEQQLTEQREVEDWQGNLDYVDESLYLV